MEINNKDLRIIETALAVAILEKKRSVNSIRETCPAVKIAEAKEWISNAERIKTDINLLIYRGHDTDN